MIITIDAMGCQKKIVEKIAEKKADYVISLKGNEQSIHNDVKEFFDHPFDENYCQCYNIQHIGVLKQLDFSDIIKAKKMPLCHKQHLCDKREDCLERALQTL